MLLDEEVQRCSFTYGLSKHLSVPSVQKIILSWMSSTCSVLTFHYIYFISRRAFTGYVSYIYIYIGELKKSGFRSCRNDPQLFRFSTDRSLIYSDNVYLYYIRFYERYMGLKRNETKYNSRLIRLMKIKQGTCAFDRTT